MAVLPSAEIATDAPCLATGPAAPVPTSLLPGCEYCADAAFAMSTIAISARE
jgi:hypothetical protein